jgi:hypothetical protein
MRASAYARTLLAAAAALLCTGALFYSAGATAAPAGQRLPDSSIASVGERAPAMFAGVASPLRPQTV